MTKLGRAYQIYSTKGMKTRSSPTIINTQMPFPQRNVQNSQADPSMATNVLCVNVPNLLKTKKNYKLITNDSKVKHTSKEFSRPF